MTCLAIDKAGISSLTSQTQLHELLIGAHFQRTLCTISRSETALCEFHNEAKRGHSEMLLNDVLHRAVGGIDDPGKSSLVSSSINVSLYFSRLEYGGAFAKSS